MSRFITKLALAALIPAFAATAAYAAFTDAQQKEIQTIVNNYLQSNPQVIITAIQGFQQKQMQEAEQTIKNTQKEASKFAAALFRTTNDPVGGNAKGTVTVVEFFDYQCPHCVDMTPIINELIKKDIKVMRARILFFE